MGLYELEASATELFQSDSCRHGDGGGGALATGPARSLTEEEVNAVIWKCRYPIHAHDRAVLVLRALPDDIIATIVAQYNMRRHDPPAPATVAYLRHRDVNVKGRRAAVATFLSFCEEKFGALSEPVMERLRNGDIPRGWFAAFTKASHPAGRAGLFCRNRYTSLFKIYKRALRAYYAGPPLALPDESAVADPSTTTNGLGGDGVLANVQTPHTARFKYRTPRVGQKYKRTRMNRQRPFERRRGLGLSGGTGNVNSK